MPLGIVSPEDFEKELKEFEDTKNPTGTVTILPSKGRKEGEPNVPDSLRKLLGDTALTEGRAESLEMAAAFGISKSSVSAYSNGSTSTKTYNDESNPLKGFLRERKNKIAKRASKKLLTAMDKIDDDKLNECSAVELATVSRAMAGIIKDMLPEEKTVQESSTVQFVMYAPPIAKESNFESVVANE